MAVDRLVLPRCKRVQRSRPVVEAPVEATYLLWLNVSALGWENPVARFEAHGVGLSDGTVFGAPKGSHVRLNFGCTRATLQKAVRRMKAALAPKARIFSATAAPRSSC